jgi:Fe-S cluster assembly ATP-binding protein
MLSIKNLCVSTDGKEILKGVNMEIKKGEVHALMGPNGSGKSTLSYVIMGHPKYKVTQGEILFEGKNILELKPHERAMLGLFLAFQYPMEIGGVGLAHFLFTLYRKMKGVEKPTPEIIREFKAEMDAKMKMLGLEKAFAERDLNVGLSGGERKRTEVLQMLMLKPALAILDEPDSGLDIDALKSVAGAVNSMRGPEFSCLVITHYQRILSHLKPDKVHVMHDGRIVKSGGPELVHELERKGYGWLAGEKEGAQKVVA